MEVTVLSAPSRCSVINGHDSIPYQIQDYPEVDSGTTTLDPYEMDLAHVEYEPVSTNKPQGQ